MMDGLAMHDRNSTPPALLACSQRRPRLRAVRPITNHLEQALPPGDRRIARHERRQAKVPEVVRDDDAAAQNNTGTGHSMN